jgi:phage tail sheath gpL-like
MNYYDVIPQDTLVPLTYFRVSGAAAAGGSTARPTLLTGQKVASGTATLDTPVRCSSVGKAIDLFGFGSMLHRMVAAYKANDPYGELWCLPVTDPTAGTKATRVLTLTGPATESGVLSLWIAGQRVPIVVASGDTAHAVAIKVQTAVGINEAAAITAKSTLPVILKTVGVADGVMTFESRWAGATGLQIDFRLNYLGDAAGESTPAGLAITELATARYVHANTAGVGVPSWAAGFAACVNKRFGYIGHPYVDGTASSGSLASWKVELSDDGEGRWSPVRKYYGHAFTAYNEGVDADGLAAVVLANDPHTTPVGVVGCPNPPWEIAAAYCGRGARAFRSDPALGLQSLELIGILPPALADQLAWGDRQTLLGLGWATTIPGDVVRVERAVTSYTENAYGAADQSFRDSETLANLDYILTDLDGMLSSKFGRVKIVPDTDRVTGAESNAVRPSTIKAAIVAKYKVWQRLGLVSDVKTFARLLR